ncbi:hypothetical protein BegalDRAFT_2829 [Beggiatoa alba B18LD]|uniref:Effector-associated domain-containing protein n=1 Tax=Beggiatoa alba B18LD TaxID=395493 RepID=I3CJ70_9GAMM|nr:hypothetical protein [Beggiatoa alba]EIJ43663.1 hypothetical protein BegalDRAFT_2829 [Beggiatoa alba B18LD]
MNVSNSTIGVIAIGDNNIIYTQTQSNTPFLSENKRKILHYCLTHSFAFHEIQTLIFFLNIDQDEFSGIEAKSRLIETLIQYCERHNITQVLINLIKNERPHLLMCQQL